jgi:upstream activation factor subunit UAF30
MPTKAKSGQTGSKSDAGDDGGKKPNALQQPLQPSKELAAVVGREPLSRSEAVRKVWAYIKQHDLQNPEDRREILADAKLEPVFGKQKVTMFEMNKHLNQHLT